MATTVGGVQIEIRGDDSHFERTMREVRSEAGRTGQTMAREFRTADAAAAKLNTSLRSTATSALALTAAFGVGAGLAGGVRIIAGFSQAMATLRAITGGTAEEIGALEQLARQLGSSTKYSASQAADAMTELARAGFDTKQVIAAIPSVLSLATAGGVELAAAAEITGVTLAQFGLQAAEAARVADVLAEAANRSNVGVTDLGEALKYAGPTGKALGLDLEQTVAVLAALGDGGLKGGQGGRSFGSVGVQLVNMREEITALIGTYDIAAEGIQGVIKRLVEAGITTEQVISIFRGENIDTFNILAAASTSTTKSIDGFVAGLKSAEGASARVAAVMADNLNGAISSAASAFEELIIALGKAGAEAALLDAVKGLTQLLVLAAKNADILGVAIVAMSARAIIPLIVSAVPAAIGALRNLGAALIATQGAAAKAAIGMNLLGGPLTLAIVAASAAYIALSRATVTMEEAQQQYNTAVDKSLKVQDELKGQYTDLERLNRDMAKAIEDGATAAELAAQREIDALQLRIDKNLDLLGIYEEQAAAALDNARLARDSARNDFSQSIGLGRRFDYNTNPEARAELDAATAAFRNQLSELRATGKTLDENTVKARDYFLAWQEAEGQIAALSRRQSERVISAGISGLGIQPGQDVGGGGTSPAAAEQTAAAVDDQLTSQLALLSAIERSQAMEEARAAGNQELVDILEQGERIQERTLDYIEAGYLLDQARIKAEGDIARLGELRAEAAEREAAEKERIAAVDAAVARGVEANRVSEEVRARSQAEAEALRDQIARSISNGLEQGIRSGNWGEALEGILAESVSSALSQAIDQLATELVGLFDGLGSSIGAGIGSLFGFAGGKAAGGPVKAGMRYLVGEQGPEMFVPSVPGVVVPKFEGPASVAAGGLTGPHVVHVSPQLNVYGSITEEVMPRVQAMMAEQARELPRMVNAVIRDGQRRGRY